MFTADQFDLSIVSLRTPLHIEKSKFIPLQPRPEYTRNPESRVNQEFLLAVLRTHLRCSVIQKLQQTLSLILFNFFTASLSTVIKEMNSQEMNDMIIQPPAPQDAARGSDPLVSTPPALKKSQQQELTVNGFVYQDVEDAPIAPDTPLLSPGALNSSHSGLSAYGHDEQAGGTNYAILIHQMANLVQEQVGSLLVNKLDELAQQQSVALEQLHEKLSREGAQREAKLHSQLLLNAEAMVALEIKVLRLEAKLEQLRPTPAGVYKRQIPIQPPQERQTQQHHLQPSSVVRGIRRWQQPPVASSGASFASGVTEDDEESSGSNDGEDESAIAVERRRSEDDDEDDVVDEREEGVLLDDTINDSDSSKS